MSAAGPYFRIVYPLLWSRLSRGACQEQSVNTAAALARHGHQVTLLMPQHQGDPSLTASDVKQHFQVEGELHLVQRPARRVSEDVVTSGLWLRRLFRDPEVLDSDLLLARIPMLLGLGASSPLPFLLDHYRPWPSDWPFIRPVVRWTAQSPSCLGLAIHSHHAAQSYREAGVAAERILVAHNGAEPRRMGVPMQKGEARARLVLPPDRPIAVYAGRLNQRKGLDQLLALAALRQETLFLLIGSEGDGPIERMAAAHDNVRVLPWQEPASLPAWLYAADLLLIPASREPLERYRTCVLPMKLFAYLAAGRPIIAPEAPDTAELLVDQHNALLVPPGSPPAAAAALDRLLAHPKLAETLGANGRALAEELTWDARAQRITDFIRPRMISAPGRQRLRDVASIPA